MSRDRLTAPRRVGLLAVAALLLLAGCPPKPAAEVPPSQNLVVPPKFLQAWDAGAAPIPPTPPTPPPDVEDAAPLEDASDGGTGPIAPSTTDGGSPMAVDGGATEPPVAQPPGGTANPNAPLPSNPQPSPITPAPQPKPKPSPQAKP